MPVRFAGLDEVQTNLVKAALYFKASGAKYMPEVQGQSDLVLDPESVSNDRFLTTAHAYASAAVSDQAYYTEFLPLADQFITNVVPVTLPSLSITKEEAHPLLDPFRPTQNQPPASLLATLMGVFDNPKDKARLDSFALMLRRMIQETLTIHKESDLQPKFKPITLEINKQPLWLRLQMLRFEAPLYEWMHKKAS